MTKLECAINRACAQGVTRVSEFKGFIPGVFMSFKLGDIFRIPIEFQVYEERFDEIINQFIFVETVTGEVRKLYPSQLSRRVLLYDTDGTPTGTIIEANGSASQFYKQFGTVSKGMDALKGKIIGVTGIRKVLNCFGPKNIYTFDLVD